MQPGAGLLKAEPRAAIPEGPDAYADEAGASSDFLRKLCSGSAVGVVGSVIRVRGAESSAGHSMPWRTKDAATSSIKPSIGALRNE